MFDKIGSIVLLAGLFVLFFSKNLLILYTFMMIATFMYLVDITEQIDSIREDIEKNPDKIYPKVRLCTGIILICAFIFFIYLMLFNAIETWHTIY